MAEEVELELLGWDFEVEDAVDDVFALAVLVIIVVAAKEVWLAADCDEVEWAKDDGDDDAVLDATEPAAVEAADDDGAPKPVGKQVSHKS